MLAISDSVRVASSMVLTFDVFHVKVTLASEATRPSGVELSLETLSCRWALRILSKKMAS